MLFIMEWNQSSFVLKLSDFLTDLFILNKYRMSAKELRDKLKALRMEHTGGALTKMTLEQVQNEIAHHETACRAREMKEKRMAALEAAREAKKAPAAAPVKVPRPPKAVPKSNVPEAKKGGNHIQKGPKKPTVTMAEVEVPKKRGRPAKAGVQTIADRAEEKNAQRQE